MVGLARRGFGVLLLLACFAVAATACGGGSTSTASTRSASPVTETTPPIQHTQPTHYSRYETAMQALGNKLALALENSGRSVSAQGATTAMIIDALRTAQRQLRASAAGLEHITPPAKIKHLHERLLTSVREFADELSTVIASAKSGSDGVHIAAMIPTLKGLKDMQRASDAITKAGYVIVVHVSG
jgi:hypothetical protein